MPQKKNPDVAELARGKAGRLVGNLAGLLTTLKGLPLAYNRDLQEDKEPLLDSVDQLLLLLPAVAGMVVTLTFHPDADGRSSRSGFRFGHRRRGLVGPANECRSPKRTRSPVPASATAKPAGIDLPDLSAVQLAEIDPRLRPELLDRLTAEGSVASRDGRGGTAPVRVRRAVGRTAGRDPSLSKLTRTGPGPRSTATEPGGRRAGRRLGLAGVRCVGRTEMARPAGQVHRRAGARCSPRGGPDHVLCRLRSDGPVPALRQPGSAGGGSAPAAGRASSVDPGWRIHRSDRRPQGGGRAGDERQRRGSGLGRTDP